MLNERDTIICMNKNIEPPRLPTLEIPKHPEYQVSLRKKLSDYREEAKEATDLKPFRIKILDVLVGGYERLATATGLFLLDKLISAQLITDETKQYIIHGIIPRFKEFAESDSLTLLRTRLKLDDMPLKFSCDLTQRDIDSLSLYIRLGPVVFHVAKEYQTYTWRVVTRNPVQRDLSDLLPDEDTKDHIKAVILYLISFSKIAKKARTFEIEVGPNGDTMKVETTTAEDKPRWLEYRIDQQ